MATGVIAEGFEAVLDEPGLGHRRAKDQVSDGDDDVKEVLENGFHQSDDPPAFSEVAEFEPDAPPAPAVDAEPEPETVTKLYFVRIPRPDVDETIIKKLQTDFQTQVNKIKVVNQKLQTKRSAVIELKKQLSMARSLKNGSQPEYQEKAQRLRQVKDLRKQYQSQSASIRDNLRGLECKTEEELEERIRECEARIAHEPMPLREEKLLVTQISKLKAQRGKVKEYGGQSSTLSDLQTEREKIGTVIKEMEEEFKILQTEREEAQRIIDDLQGKLKKAEEALQEDQDEQEQAVAEKNNILVQLDQARAGIESKMKDYRENRKFSLQIRDMVAAGQVENAQLLCFEQTDSIMSRYNTNTAFRKQYTELWAKQRRYAVSELLPSSCQSSIEVPKPKEQVKGKAAPKPKPAAGIEGLTGGDKVKAVLAAVMQEASREAQAVARSRIPDEDDEDVEPVKPVPVVEKEVVKPIVPVKAVSRPPPDAPVKVELPELQDNFELPTAPKIAAAEQLSEEETKAKLREEQKRKAQEAEERKKKQAELAAKKKVKAEELKKKKEEEEKKKALKAPEPVAVAVEEEVVQEVVEEQKRQLPAQVESSSAAAPVVPAIVKVTKTAVAKRPKDDKLSKKIKKWLKQHTVELVVAAVILLLGLLFVLGSNL